MLSIFVSLTACSISSDDEMKTETDSVTETIARTERVTEGETNLLTSEKTTKIETTLTTSLKKKDKTEKTSTKKKEKTTKKSKEELYKDIDYVNSVIPALSENYDFKVFYYSIEKQSSRNKFDNLFGFCDWYFRRYLRSEEYIVESGLYGDYEYTLYESGSVCITAYKGKSKEIIVPEKINGHPVAYIGEFAFERNLRITKVVLPDTVLYLDSGAFSQCLFLKEIDLGESLACLYGNTFYYCRFMKKIKLPDTLLYIGVFAFQSCTSLSEVEGGNALKFISRKTFIVVPSLDKLRLPKDIVIEHEDSIAPNVKVEYY